MWKKALIESLEDLRAGFQKGAAKFLEVLALPQIREPHVDETHCIRRHERQVGRQRRPLARLNRVRDKCQKE
jgi:hypothetical protein